MFLHKNIKESKGKTKRKETGKEEMWMKENKIKNEAKKMNEFFIFFPYPFFVTLPLPYYNLILNS